VAVARGGRSAGELRRIVGLHPDSATEPIVEALVLKLPWFVVPCCFFPNLMPRLVKGRLARTRARYCESLQLKAAGAQTLELPFEGANTAVFWLPPAAEAAAVASSSEA
jgi:hypothetical protein